MQTSLNPQSDTGRTTDLAARERQKDREIEKLRMEVDALDAINSQCREDLARATSSMYAQRDALQEILLGYSPAEHTAFVFAPEGTVLAKGSWIVTRRAP